MDQNRSKRIVNPQEKLLQIGNGSRRKRIPEGLGINWIPQIEPATWKTLSGIPSRVAILVYVSLASRANIETGVSWPSRRRLANETGFSERAVTKAVASLIKVGLINRIPQKTGWKTNCYQVFGLRPPSKWRRDDEFKG